MTQLSRLLPLLLLLACNREQPTDTDQTQDTDDTDQGPECTEDDHCPSTEICEDEECVVGDRDNGFEEAASVFLNQTYEGEINPAGDVDYYAYESTGDEWLRVQTISPEEDDTLDTVLVVYAANGAVHLAMDNYATGRVSTYDSLAYVYLPTAGTWYISVEDVSTFSGETARGDASFDYTLELQEWSSTTKETDSIEEPSATVDITSGSSIWAIGVNLEEADDVDYIGVSMPWDEAPLMVYGVSEIQGSDAEVRVEVVDSEGQVVLSKDDIGPEGPAGYYLAQEADYTVQTSDRLGGGGADYWYVLYFRTYENGSTAALETEPNDTLETAEVLDDVIKETSGGNLYSEFAWQGGFGVEGDEDWVSIMVEDPYLTMRCSSDYWGSLANPAVDLYAPDGTLHSTITDGSDSAPDFTNLEIESGVWWARLYDEDGGYGPGAWYTCLFWSTDFEVAE